MKNKNEKNVFTKESKKFMYKLNSLAGDFKNSYHDGNAREFFRIEQIAKATINSEGNDILEPTHFVPYISRFLMNDFYNNVRHGNG